MRPKKRARTTTSSSRISEEMKQEDTPTIPAELWSKAIEFVGDDLVGLNNSILTSKAFKEESIEHVRKLSAEAGSSMKVVQLIDSVGRFPNLEEIDLSLSKIDENGLALLAMKHNLNLLPNLKSLSLESCGRISEGNTSLRYVSQLDTLKHLSLMECDRLVGGLGLSHIYQNLTQLVSLSIGALDLQDEMLNGIGQLVNLRTLDLNTSQITGAGLVNLHTLTNLRSLELSYNENLTLAGLGILVNTVGICELIIDEASYTDWPAGDQEGEAALATIEQRVAENRERLQLHLPETPPSPSPSIQKMQTEGKEDKRQQPLTAGVRLQPHDSSRGGVGQ